MRLNYPGCFDTIWIICMLRIFRIESQYERKCYGKIREIIQLPNTPTTQFHTFVEWKMSWTRCGKGKREENKGKNEKNIRRKILILVKVGYMLVSLNVPRINRLAVIEIKGFSDSDERAREERKWIWNASKVSSRVLCCGIWNASTNSVCVCVCVV